MQAIKTTEEINQLFVTDLEKINLLGRAKFSCVQILECLKKIPQTSVQKLAKELGVSSPTARTGLNNLVKLGIVVEITGKRRDKFYVYKKYLELLEVGTEPI